MSDGLEESLWRDFFLSDRSSEAVSCIIDFYSDFTKNVSSSLYLRYRHLGVSSEDCIQQGFLGLLDAINKYSPGKASFKTYSAYRIKGSIHNFLATYSEYLDIYNFKKKQNREFTTQSTLSAKVTSLSDVYEMALLLSYDTILEEINEEASVDYIDNQLVSNSIGFFLMDYAANLDEREANIIHAYYFLEMTFREIAKDLNISTSRVFELHTSALKNLRALYQLTNDINMAV